MVVFRVCVVDVVVDIVVVDIVVVVGSTCSTCEREGLMTAIFVVTEPIDIATATSDGGNLR